VWVKGFVVRCSSGCNNIIAELVYKYYLKIGHIRNNN
jgi:hypothetical protein